VRALDERIHHGFVANSAGLGKFLEVHSALPFRRTKHASVCRPRIAGGGVAAVTTVAADALGPVRREVPLEIPAGQAFGLRTLRVTVDALIVRRNPSRTLLLGLFRTKRQSACDPESETELYDLLQHNVPDNGAWSPKLLEQRKARFISVTQQMCPKLDSQFLVKTKYGLSPAREIHQR
jgi:hypothetical protein